MVEDVDTQCTTDCADTTAFFVSFTSTVLSTRVPRSGSAPDVKRGVLNSHVLINGQNFPSLASSDSESPANDLEVGFPVELRQTVTMEREVQIPVSRTKHVWYSEHGMYCRFEIILEQAMSATHVAVIPRTRTSPAYEEEFTKMDYPDARNGYSMS